MLRYRGREGRSVQNKAREKLIGITILEKCQFCQSLLCSIYDNLVSKVTPERLTRKRQNKTYNVMSTLSILGVKALRLICVGIFSSPQCDSLKCNLGTSKVKLLAFGILPQMRKEL